MTFKDKHIHKLYAFALAAVFALTLAGCGGGGTAAMPDPEPPVVEPEPTPQETCEADGGRYNADGSCTSAEDLAAEMTEAEALSAAQEAAMAAYMAAAAAVAGAVDPVAMANAQPSAAAAMAASDAAAAATDSATAMEHQMAAEAARDMAMEAAMTRGLAITTTANAAANQSAIDSAELVGVPAPAPISNAGRVGAALGNAARAPAASITVAAAIDSNGDGTVDTLPTHNQGNVAAADNTRIGRVNVAARHTGTAPRFTVNATTNAANAANPLRRGETPTALTMRGGWAGAELGRTVAGAAGWREYAVIFTDINPPAQTYNAAGTGAVPDFTQNIVDTTGDGAADAPATNISVVTGDIPGDGSSFVGTFNLNPSDGNPPRSGRFVCAPGAACSISVDDSGVLRAIQNYTFQPAVAGTVARQDTDYLTWGVWVSVPNTVPAPGVANTAATVAAFATGSNAFAVPAALTGSATYNGVASGLYTAGGLVEHFEADASLTADFGGRSADDATPTVPADANTLFGAVTGSITNIKAGGMDVEGSLTLGRAPVLSADGNAAATTFNGSTGGTLGGRAMSGTWAGQFYGPNRAAGVAIRTEFPTTAAGTFGAATAVSPGVRILGSFGAWRAE